MRILRGHLTTATTGLGSIAASKFTDHEPSGMENPPLRFAEVLKPVYGYRYFSTRMCAVGGFLHE